MTLDLVIMRPEFF